ncbi:MAG: TM0106 family RecB-like putative nuclease [Actinomycetota bacterium]
MLITDKLLLSYQRCDRRGFLDVYGDFSQLDPPSDFLLKLIQDSFGFQRSVLQDFTYQQPSYPRGDWVAGAAATLALMQQGVDYIYRGVLLHSPTNYLPSDTPVFGGMLDPEVPDTTDRLLGSTAATLLSRPQLLVKQSGTSIFGNWMYVPTDIWLGKRPKLDYQLIAAFHAEVLAAVQGEMPEIAWLVLREKGFYGVNLKQRLPQMQQILAECIQTLLQKQEPEVFIARQKCSLCRWYSSCHAIAQSQQHLSLLPGVTPNRYNKLKTLNLKTVGSLANTSPQFLATYPEFGEEIAGQLVQQAQSIVENRAFLRTRLALQAMPHSDSPLTPWLPVSTSLSAAPVELYFDIEAEPELNLDYLHGVLVVDRRSQTETFHALLAEAPEEEGVIWQKFLELVWSYPIAPIYHFCDYEIQTVKRLAKRYHTPAYQWQPILKRFVDIHKQVTQTVTMPVESYALKPIARWVGFEWRDPKANGAQCVCWYDEWLKTGDRSFLEAIVGYNEDDCRATYQVKEWLAKFLKDL